jgi:two-component system, NtrC family, sensor kinase
MGRGPKPARSKEAKPPAARKRPKEEGTRGRDLEKQLAESLEREKATGRALTEALEQQTATSDVLRVISQSQTDIQPVFDALIESATRLCVADIGAISRLEGDILRLVLHSGMSAEVRSFWDENPPPLARSSVTGRAALERRTMHVPDILADSSYDYASAASPLRKGQAVTGYRAALVTPMLRDGAVIGTIAMLRREAGPFTESQIKLLETFADQAVIAIENVRLFTELEARNRDLTTALDQRTATAEILRVISSSPTDVQPTFDAIAENATRLCRGVSALVTRRRADPWGRVPRHW